MRAAFVPVPKTACQSQDTMSPATAVTLQAEYRSIIFALCYFHAALLERKKFGVGNLPAATSGIGWNMNYPFNTGDLLCCGQCASNYLENNVKASHMLSSTTPAQP